MINVQNIEDIECFKWCLVRHLQPTDHNPRKIRKVAKDFARKVNFKDIKFPVKVRDIHKIEEKNCIGISIFSYEKKEKYPIHLSRNTFKIHVNLLLIGEKVKRFSTFMYDQTLHRGRKHFCRYCLHDFSTK